MKNIMMPYYLGCPLWSKKEWIGELFTQNAKPADYLGQYASVFNTVEGNTTFYALPKEETVAKWEEKTPETFKFCFKFPQQISHNRRLKNAESETRDFLQRLAPIASRLGPFFLQLPPSFGGDSFFSLVAFVNSLPTIFRYAVEVRHQDFYGGGHWEHALNDLLSERNIDRVLFDTRGLHAVMAEKADQATREAQRRKPKIAVQVTATGDYPFVRFIGNPVIEENRKALEQWVRKLAQWIANEKRPFFFMHEADDFYAPRLARYFHNIVRQIMQGMPPLSEWPVEVEEIRAKQQMDLF
ncbi:MAG: DUF72 domain-containing protein [bacterium]